MDGAQIETLVRFFTHVKQGESVGDCWVWTGNRPDGRYGHFSVNGVSLKSHRWLWTFFNGPIPDDLILRHKCDNPPCVNPLHLEIGTHSDNQRDKFDRGRGVDRRGIKHPLAKLTEPDVLEIRRLAACKVAQSVIADKFGIGRGQVGKIVQRLNWRHI